MVRNIHIWMKKSSIALFISTSMYTSASAEVEVTTGGTSLKAGQLVSVSENRLNPLSSASENHLVAYVSTSFNGENTVVYGQVSLPTSPAPEGGYPVISWANGTTGFAPQCAPSLVDSYADEYLNAWLDRGYAVLRTDYEGWGAAGPRPLVHGRSNANTVADIVAAAHQLSDRLSDEWLVVGHSEGGGAALWNAALSDRTGSDFPLKGVIAIAPIGPGILHFMEGAANDGFIHQLAQPFVSVTVLAAQTVDPSIDLSKLVAEPMQPQVEAARHECLMKLRELPQLEKGDYLNAGADFDKLAAFLNEQDPSSLELKVPAFIVQATNDQTTVTPTTTGQMIDDLCKNGAVLAYEEYAEEDHISVIAASQEDAFQYADALLAGQTPPNLCDER